MLISYDYLYIFLDEVSVKAYFLIRLFVSISLSFKSLLYALDDSPLSDMSSANIFSQHVISFFILLTLCFVE